MHRKYSTRELQNTLTILIVYKLTLMTYCNGKEMKRSTIGDKSIKTKEINPTLNKDKCIFNQSEIQYTGHVISKN